VAAAACGLEASAQQRQSRPPADPTARAGHAVPDLLEQNHPYREDGRVKMHEGHRSGEGGDPVRDFS